MKVTENEKIIQNVINRTAPKYTFGCYELEDIKQEAWGIALEILDKWDGERPLENFMTVCLNNRLQNLKRNKFFRQGTSGKRLEINERKRQLMCKAEEYLDLREWEGEYEDVLTKDEIEQLLGKLPYTIRADFNRLANNVSIPNHRKVKVYQAVKELYEQEHGPSVD